jgi:hypothetical protein
MVIFYTICYIEGVERLRDLVSLDTIRFLIFPDFHLYIITQKSGLLRNDNNKEELYLLLGKSSGRLF